MCLNHEQDSHKHNSDDDFNELLKGTANNANEQPGLGASSDADLVDDYQPEEQKRRSHYISEILHSYEHAYGAKTEFQGFYRKVLFWGCGGVIVLFAIAISVVVIIAADNSSALELGGIATIITSVISLVVAMLELVRIITKYCFPENDEEYIVRIVEAIQGNDLEKIKERNRSVEAREKREHPAK